MACFSLDVYGFDLQIDHVLSITTGKKVYHNLWSFSIRMTLFNYHKRFSFLHDEPIVMVSAKSGNQTRPAEMPQDKYINNTGVCVPCVVW